MRRLTAALFAVALCIAALPTHAALAADRCFPETNQCSAGRFGDSWQQNGGLPIFGFPITGAANEVNRDTGQTYRATTSFTPR